MANIKDSLKALIRNGETSKVEFMSAKGGFPTSFWKSYSAFANTNGGVIILGVTEKDNKFTPNHLTEDVINSYLKNFWDCVHNKEKISICLLQESDVRIECIDDSYLLIFDIPRANYEARPVYVGPNPFGHTYRRFFVGNYRCTDEEVKRMFAGA